MIIFILMMISINVAYSNKNILTYLHHVTIKSGNLMPKEQTIISGFCPVWAQLTQSTQKHCISWRSSYQFTILKAFSFIYIFWHQKMYIWFTVPQSILNSQFVLKFANELSSVQYLYTVRILPHLRQLHSAMLLQSSRLNSRAIHIDFLWIQVSS
jgi:hypothetical protein